MPLRRICKVKRREWWERMGSGKSLCKELTEEDIVRYRKEKQDNE